MLSGNVQLERARTPQPTIFLTGTNSLTQNTDIYNFQYTQGFITGTALSVGFNNSRYQQQPQLQLQPGTADIIRAQLTQHLLNGFGTGVNGRFIAQAINDRHITDSAFRQQLLFTINQVENIYWALVSAYEDVLSKQRALAQSTQVASDDRKQLEIGTLAPLDVLNADNQVAQRQAGVDHLADQSRISATRDQTGGRAQPDDPALVAGAGDSDRPRLADRDAGGDPISRRSGKEAYQNRPEIEQAILNLKNDQITLKGVKNGMLPAVDLYAFYGSAGLGGAAEPSCGNRAASSNPRSECLFVPRSPTATCSPTCSTGAIRTRAWASTSRSPSAIALRNPFRRGR